MPTILTTKKLKENQKSLLLNANIAFVEYDAITIEFVPFKVPTIIENAIFTSQNAVLSILNSEITIQNCYCVGEKTKFLLEKNGQKVAEMTEYAAELADYIVKNHKNDSFHFFCGNIRSDEIPSKLKKENVVFQEVEVYKTNLNPKKFERHFDAILFFSPSGVRSYFELNSGQHIIAICIGNTTASEAKNYTENVIIANATTVESVIAKTAKVLKTFS